MPSELERRLERHDQAIKSLFSAIRELAAPPAKPRGEIGFHVKEESVRIANIQKPQMASDEHR